MEFQESILDYKKASKILTLKGFHKFVTSDEALENARDVIYFALNETLVSFLTEHIRKKDTLLVIEPKLAKLYYFNLESMINLVAK